MLDLEQRQRLAALATKPGGPQFYRDLYRLGPEDSALSIADEKQWRALPFVTKDALIAMPLRSRSFLPFSALDHLRASSGTSGKPPLFSPRTKVRGMEYRLQHHDFKNAFLAFTVPLMPHWHEEFQRDHGLPGRVIAYDPKNNDASVRLAKAAGVDGFSVFVHHARPIAEGMKREGIAGRIRFIELCGETVSRELYDYLHETFPNATLMHSYGSSEVEDVHMGMPCKPMDGTEPLSAYHPKDSHYLEIVDPETGEPLEVQTGIEGELVVTAYPGEPSAFPLLRFRIGDRVRVLSESCPHGLWTYTVLGRTTLDFVKVPGGELRIDEIGRVLRLFPERVSDLFELHCYTEISPQGPLLAPVLKVEPRAEVDLDALARDIAANLRTGPSFTYAQGVAEGRYLPLRCEKMERSGLVKKHTWIVRH